MENRREKISALTVSLLAHLVFIVIAIVYKMPNINVIKPMREKTYDVRIFKEANPAVSSQTKTVLTEKSLRFEGRDNEAEMRSFLEKEEKAMDKNEPVFSEESLSPRNVEESDRIYDVKEIQLTHDLPGVSAKQEGKKGPTDLFKIDYATLIYKPGEHSSMETLGEDFIDKMPGFTPSLTVDNLDMSQRAVGQMAEKQEPVIKRTAPVGDFAEELVWALETYTDPKDNQKYFRVKIRAGEQAKSLPTIPKEVVILADCSNSVEDERFKEFREGMASSLKKLNEGDFFNVVFFKEWIFEFKPESVKATEENINEAIAFMQEFYVGEKTDAFEVLEKSVKRQTNHNPSYIVLLSDGRPTKGVTKPREVINKISKLNEGRKPIFAFSGGQGVNRYLLDFITYKNRGWAEYSYRTHQINENLIKMFEKIDEPMIMSLRYFVSGIDERETFPLQLPDFFRNAEFTLYGKYEDERELVIQLLGDAGGKTREFMMKGSFDQAERGDQEIAKNWAYNKIYHLISLLNFDQDNRRLLDEISALSKKFGFKTPYLEDIIK